jgi:diaminopimelate epimerase
MNAIEIPFAKVSGAGNDFVAVDNIAGILKVDWPAFARAACERHFGVGADGLLVLAPSMSADFTMLYFNADGSSGGMCGNGGRCCVMFARLNGLEHDDITFDALGYLYRATFTGNGIRVAMKDPEKIRRGIPVHVTAGKFLCHAVDTGAPHIVTYVEDLDSADVFNAGRELRSHSEFQPEGTNVNFVKVLGHDAIAIRTYERGVEAETLACGTGSIASAVISAMEKGIAPPVTVLTRSGEQLRVGLSIEGGNVRGISLEGHARIIFSSKVLYDPASETIEAQDGI